MQILKTANNALLLIVKSTHGIGVLVHDNCIYLSDHIKFTRTKKSAKYNFQNDFFLFDTECLQSCTTVNSYSIKAQY